MTRQRKVDKEVQKVIDTIPAEVLRVKGNGVDSYIRGYVGWALKESNDKSCSAHVARQLKLWASIGRPHNSQPNGITLQKTTRKRKSVPDPSL